MKKANFRLDPDNIGLFTGLALVAFMYHYFNEKLTKPIHKVDFNAIQTALASL